MHTLTIDYNDKQFERLFVKSLHETGFAVIKNHDINESLINRVYNNWSDFFNSDYKHKYIYDIDKQDGYFPMKSENAKGYRIKDLKEFYHIYLPWGRIPVEINNDTIKLRNQLVDLGAQILGWIEDNTPNEISKYFLMPLKDMICNSQNNLLRIIHYPPLRGSDHQDALRAAPHGDINMITILISGSEPGLQVLNKDNEWIDVESDKGLIVINSGDMLNKCSNGYYPSTVHRVINPKGNNDNVSRYSMPLFLHARDEVHLTNNFTAKQFLEQRLKELGLK